jgi:hypothetical protein
MAAREGYEHTNIRTYEAPKVETKIPRYQDQYELMIH